MVPFAFGMLSSLRIPRRLLNNKEVLTQPQPELMV